MARTDLTVNSFVRAGLADPSGEAVAAADDAMVLNDGGKTVVRIANASGSLANLVFETPYSLTGLALSDEAATLANGATKWFGPWEANIFNQQSGADVGKVYIDTDQPVTMTAFKLP